MNFFFVCRHSIAQACNFWKEILMGGTVGDKVKYKGPGFLLCLYFCFQPFRRVERLWRDTEFAAVFLPVLLSRKHLHSYLSHSIIAPVISGNRLWLAMPLTNKILKYILWARIKKGVHRRRKQCLLTISKLCSCFKQSHQTALWLIGKSLVVSRERRYIGLSGILQHFGLQVLVLLTVM